jgi:hypothetical protein
MSSDENEALVPKGETIDDGDGEELEPQEDFYEDPRKFDRVLDYLVVPEKG